MNPAATVPEQLRTARVAVVIVNYRTPDLTLRCVASLRSEKEALPDLKVVVVDGGSADGSADMLRKGLDHPDYLGWVSFLPLETNGGFGWANNQAILTLARLDRPPEFIHLLNPDAELTEGAVIHLVSELQAHPRCAAAGSQLFTSEGRAAASAFRFPAAGRELVSAAQSEKLGGLVGIAPTLVSADQNAEVDWVTGASFMLRTEALHQTGLFDDGFFLYFEEVELMHRLRAKGWTVRHVQQSQVVHLEGAATGAGALASRLPRYWYQSRRRYFALTGGRSAVLKANLGWLTGRAIRFGKFLFGKSRTDGLRLTDLLRYGGLPRRWDETPSIAAWGEAPGRPPAWMARR